MSDRVEVTYFYEGEDEGFVCSHSTNLVFDDCILEAGQSRLCSSLGCSSPFLPKWHGCPDCEINLFNRS